MKFKIFHSSSKGNLYAVTAKNGDRILLEAGVTIKEIKKSLKYDFSNILGCFITHNHTDHAKACKDLLHSGIDIYSSAGTLSALGCLDNYRAKIISHGKVTKLGAFTVFAYTSIHDTKEPLMFVVKCDNEFLLFTVDTGYIPYTFKIPFKYLCIECSFDRVLLHENFNNLPRSVIRRIENTHLDKDLTLDYILNKANTSKCEKIYLLHGSGTNIEKEKVRNEIEQRTFLTTTWK